MTDHRDPVEAWLSQDVELLPPQPGSFQRVRRRARRRKAVRAMTAAAGAVVIVAAAAILPQVAGNLLPGGTGPEKAGSTAAGQSRSSQHSSHPAPAPSPASSASQPGPPLSALGSGSPPPANFEPTSVTFVGPYTGAVLGQGGPGCAKGLCTAVAGTADYGRTWTAMAAPPTGAPDGSSGISQIRFLNLHDGWAYGPQLYATHDGGATWAPISTLPGRIIDLAAVGNRVFALSARCTGQGRTFASGCTSFALYSASAGSDRWRPVPGAAGQGATTPGALQLTSSGGYLLAGHRVYSGPVMASPWHRAAAAPGSQPPCLRPASRQVALIAPNGSDLYLTCGAIPAGGAGGQAGGTGGTGAAGSLTLYLSADAGQSWQSRGPITARGTATSLAVSPGGIIILATTAGIWQSADAVSWHQALIAAPRGGFTFAGMTTAGQGVAIPANWALHELFVTHDGGRTWQPRLIR